MVALNGKNGGNWVDVLVAGRRCPACGKVILYKKPLGFPSIRGLLMVRCDCGAYVRVPPKKAPGNGR